MRKIIAIIQAALQIWVPACLLFWSVSQPLPAWADRFMDSAHQGQSMGLSLIPDPSTLADQSPSGDLNLHWKGKTSTFNPQDLFPDQSNTSDPHADTMFGNNAAVVSGAQSEVNSMATSPSETGKAYQLLQNSVLNRARVNMSNDPIWDQTDDVISQVLAGVYSDCQIVVTDNPDPNQGHIPDYRTCERVKYPGGTCKCYHDYTVDLISQIGVTVGAMTDDSAEISVNLKTGAVSCWGPHGVSNCQLLSQLPEGDVCAAPSEGITKALTTYTNTYNSGVLQVPTCPDLIATFYVHNTAGSHAWEWRTASSVVNIVHILDKGWTCDPGCEVLLTNPHGDNFIRPTSYTCTMGPCDQCAELSGAWVCEGDLYSTNPFASICTSNGDPGDTGGGRETCMSNLAHEVTITLEDFNQGQMHCWTDPQGQVHCPPNYGDRPDTCGELENDPDCSYIRQQCIEDAQDPDSGICYAWDVIYDCGVNTNIDDTKTTINYLCDGILRCMGEGCIQGQFDPNNTGFAKAAALLQAIQYAASDTDCTETNVGCKIFTGKLLRCKKALGGWVDCCVQPEGVSFINYIKLLMETFTLTSAEWDLANILPNPFASNPFNGSWVDLSSYTDKVSEFMQETFSSAWDSLTGASEAAATPEIANSLTQTLMQNAYDFIESISPDLANAIFDTGFGNIGTIVFSEGMQTLMSVVSFIMWVYTIYNILDILVHIIWSCEQEEFELGAKKQLKVCHFLGSYCHSEVLGICIEKKESYCCYNSPLARIMQEQIRNQIDGWGNAKNPNCSGLLVSQLASVNWDLVDLSEWLAILNIAGKYPTQRDLTLDGLTGQGSQFNFGNTNSPRPDTAARIQDRINQSGEDLEQLRIQGGLNLWQQGAQ